MQLFRTLRQLPESATGAVLALGNFDGVHAGHRAVIAEAKRLAQGYGTHTALMTFNPHPREFFSPGVKPLQIYPFRTKARLLADAGIDTLHLVRFNAGFAQLSAAEFIEDILAKRLRVRHVVTGANFTFGHKRQGDSAMLAAQNSFGYTCVSPILAANEIASSTRIRTALKNGDITSASTLLGRPYAISGHVVHGDKRGRTLGFPTANIPVWNILAPKYGVYAVRAQVGGAAFTGVANLGIRPSFGGTIPLLEVHCFDMHREVYGMRMEVELVAPIRDEQKFDGLDALRAQITRDVDAAKAVLHA